jgi:hypothetical protein
VTRTKVGLVLCLAVTLLESNARSQERQSFQVLPKSVPQSVADAPGYAGYVGDEVCGSCHHDRFGTFQLTAHHRTSQLPNANSIAGPFAPPENTVKTIDPALSFRMEIRNGGFYETAIFGEPPHSKQHSEMIGIVVGSGKKGQTYLYWKGDELYELPISYWIELRRWVNSPGYLDGTANFDRPVIPRCVECHATYFDSLSPAPLQNRFDKTNFVLGISCERCHGPGAEHVKDQRSATGNATIVNPAKLSRERKMDTCAQCHGGLGESVAPAFSFRPGEPLANYIKLQPPAPCARVDVHGNQVALLEKSRCFQSSNLSCTTCHDEHEPERPAASYSNRCIECHQPEKCGMYKKLGSQISKNCIDCHMPIQQSNLIVSDLGGSQARAKVRNHWIKIYADSPGH